jgi:beta-galactosidase
MDPHLFPIGSNWGGFMPRDEWDNDFYEMRKAGLNAARIAFGFPGITVPPLKHWEDIDRMFELGLKYDIGLAVSLITILIPQHFFSRYPDIRFIDIDGQPFPRNIEDLTWPQACFNHPGYRGEIVGFFETAVTRYKDAEPVLAWMVHNEPCNPWGGTGCYCPHTVGVFRTWLQERYGDDLDEVNRLWGTTFAGWGDVEPPRTRPKEGGNLTAWIDWMTFGEWNVTDFIRWEAELVRKLDPAHPVGTNTMGGMLLPITTAQNEKELAKVLDFIGQDWYPSWTLGRRKGEKAQLEKYVGAKLDMTRWAVGDRRAIVAEVQAGPNAESIWFSPDEMRIAGWQAVAHGLKGLFYYRWDPIISGQEPWVHHMRTIEGGVTERVDEAGRLARELGHMVGLVADSAPMRAPVALLYSRSSKIVAEAEGLFDPQYRQAIMGTYRLFADNHIPVDWIDVDDVEAGRLGAYRVLLMPFTCCLDEGLAQAIHAWVKQGGILIAEPFCAARDERGVPYGRVPGARLDEVFGCTAESSVNYRYWLVAHALEMTAEGAEISGVPAGAKFWLCGLRETVRVTSEAARVLARFIEYPPLQTSSPAAVVHPYGQGTAVYLAGGLGEAYVKMEMPYLRQLVGGLMAWLGVAGAVEVEGVSAELAQDLEIMVLDAEDTADRTVVVINHADDDVQATLRIQVRRPGRLQVRELISFRSLPVQVQGERIVVAAAIPARDVAVFNVYALA